MGKFVAWNVLLILTINLWWLCFTNDADWFLVAIGSTAGIAVWVATWMIEHWSE